MNMIIRKSGNKLPAKYFCSHDFIPKQRCLLFVLTLSQLDMAAAEVKTVIPVGNIRKEYALCMLDSVFPPKNLLLTKQLLQPECHIPW